MEKRGRERRRRKRRRKMKNRRKRKGGRGRRINKGLKLEIIIENKGKKRSEEKGEMVKEGKKKN